MSKALVTGGAGFIGSHIVDRLISDGHEVVVLDNLATGKIENVNEKAQFEKVDIADYEDIKDYFAGVEVVFHTAALARIQPSIEDPISAHEANVNGTLNVLWAAHKAGVKKFVYSASSSAYGDQSEDKYPLSEELRTHPGSPYALQKLIGEQYCKLFSEMYNLPTVILRYFNVYGPRQITDGAYAAVIGIFLKQRESGQPMTLVEDAEIKRRDFTYIDDVVEANILSWKKEIPAGEVFNIGFGKNHSVKEVADLIGGEKIFIPKRPGEYPITLADNTKAKKLLGWEPKIALEDVIDDLKRAHGL